MIIKQNILILILGKYQEKRGMHITLNFILNHTVNILHSNFSAVIFVPIIKTKELKGLQFIANFLSGDFMDRSSDGNASSDDDDTKLNATSICTINYSFIDYVSHAERRVCFLNGEADEIRMDQEAAANAGGRRRRAPIKVKCLPSNETANSTLIVIDSITQLAQLLGPLGNVTKRTQPGICTLILFYTKSCVSSSLAAPHMNALPKYFPDIRMGAMDSFRFHSVNTEFGIIALPTLMLFHRGRPIVKFNESLFSVNNFVKFIGRHTDIEPVTSKIFVTSDDFRGPLSNKVEKVADNCLWLAWIFIGLVICYHFARSKYCTQIIEVIKRNWRESSETQN